MLYYWICGSISYHHVGVSISWACQKFWLLEIFLKQQSCLLWIISNGLYNSLMRRKQFFVSLFSLQIIVLLLDDNLCRMHVIAATFNRENILRIKIEILWGSDVCATTQTETLTADRSACGITQIYTPTAYVQMFSA